jgi:hypothetical protein
VLLELEGEMAAENQKKLRLLREEYKELKSKKGDGNAEYDDEESFLDEELGNGIPAHLAVPSQQVVASVLLKKKKEELLNRFT